MVEKWDDMNTEKRLSQILVVDDTPENIQLLGAILKTNGYQIIVAENGLQVFDAIDLVVPDLILLDVMMPKMDGFEVCRRLKADDKTKDIPIIFLTAKSEMADIVNGFKLGAVDYIVKPFQMTELLARVKTHLDLKFYREEAEQRVEDIARMKREHESLLRHEMNNQLMPIMGYAQMFVEMKNDNLTEEQLRRIQVIFDNSQRLVRVVEGLRDIQSLEDGSIRLKVADVDLDKMIVRIVEDLKVGFVHQAIVSVDNQLDSSVIKADGDMLEGALINLIKNAIEHVSDLPDDRDVLIHFAEQKDRIVIEIKNGGPLISPERLCRFFEKFNTDRDRKIDGTGLGTTHAYWVVNAHQGDIDVISQEGLGTVVTVTLPKNMSPI